MFYGCRFLIVMSVAAVPDPDGFVNGCPISALACDIARGTKQIGSLATEKVKSYFELLANLLPQDDSAARSKAILTVSALLGAVQLARAETLPS